MMPVPQELVDYLHTMITPIQVGGETLTTLDLGVDFSAIPDERYHGVIACGEPTEEQVNHLWRIVRPGGHVFLIAPEGRPTGHVGACALEDGGFEIRDAILYAGDPGDGDRLHYVAKANGKERNLGCGDIAARRTGPPMYMLPDEIDEDVLAEVQEALLESGLSEEVIEQVQEKGLLKAQVPASVRKHFKKQDASKKYGNSHPCLHPDALVMTERGFRPIREVRVGSRVYAQDGTFHSVEYVSQHPYTSGHLYEIAVVGTNYTSLVSDNHPFLVWRVSRSRKGGIRGGEVLWLAASEMRKGDYTLTPVLTRPRAVIDLTMEFWFIFGLWVAEGVIQRAGHGENGYPSFSLHVDETHLIDRIRSFFGADKVSVYPKGTSKGVQVMGFVPEIGRQFEHLGGRGASTKTLHPDIWLLPEEAQRAVLDGYMAGDGGRVRKHLQAKTVSPDLASQMALLGEAVGYKASLYRFEPEFGKGIQGRKFKSVQPSYQIQLYETNQALTTRKPSKPGFIEHEGVKYSLRYVKGIRHVPYSGDVWNLSVEGSPTFQTAVGMSHNTVKPVGVLKRLLVDIPSGATVLDPFMGSGSMGLACLGTDHSYIGIEKEAEYLEIADARVREWNSRRGVAAADVLSDAPPPPPVVHEIEDGSLEDLFSGGE